MTNTGVSVGGSYYWLGCINYSPIIYSSINPTHALLFSVTHTPKQSHGFNTGIYD
jgi:hypothetical protein